MELTITVKDKDVSQISDDTMLVMAEIATERRTQDNRWGEQNHASGTGPDVKWFEAVQPLREYGSRQDVPGPAVEAANAAKASYESHGGAHQWIDVLLEEVAEAFCEEDPARLREELVQVAAVSAAWIECLDRNGGDK